jgi:hypothetical protein
MATMTTRPTPREQRAAIKALEAEGAFDIDRAEVGARWWVVGLEWYNKWRAHVNWFGTNNGIDDDDDDDDATDHPLRRPVPPAPGPISNLDILADGRGADTQRLRPGLQCDQHYTLLPDAAWAKLAAWYTVAEAQRPGLARHVVGAGEKAVEVSAPVFDLLIASEDQPGGDPAEALEVILAKSDRLDALADTVFQQLEARGKVDAKDKPAPDGSRLWFSLGKGKPWFLVPTTTNTAGRTEGEDLPETVAELTPTGSDTSVCRVPSPRLLVDMRQTNNVGW